MLRRLALVAIALQAGVLGQQGAFELPENPKAVVLSLDYEGGFTPPRTTKDPFLSVLGDGTLLVPDIYGTRGGRTLQGRLTVDQLQELLRFVVEEQRFLAWDAGTVARALAAAGGGAAPVIVDAATTVIRLNLPGKRGEARQNALHFAAQSAPGIDPLQRLRAVEKRLLRHMHLVQAGGEEKVRGYLQQLNKRLGADHPGEPSFRMEDLSAILDLPPGGHTLRFVRQEGTATALGSVVIPARGDSEVEIQIDRH